MEAGFTMTGDVEAGFMVEVVDCFSFSFWLNLWCFFFGRRLNLWFGFRILMFASSFFD